MRLLTAIEFRDSETLLKKGKLCVSAVIKYLNQKLIEQVRESLYNNTYLEGGVILCICKVNGDEVNILEHFEDVADYYSLQGTYIVLEIEVPNDRIIYSSFNEVLRANDLFESVDNYSEELEGLMEDILTLNQGNSDNVVSFIPYIKLKDCKKFIALDQNWSKVEYTMGEIPEIDLEENDVNKSE